MMQDLVVDKHASVKNALADIATETDVTNLPPATSPVPMEEEKITPPETKENEKPSYATNEYIEAATDTAFAILDNTQATVFTIAANYKRRKRAIQIAGENGVAKMIQLKEAKEFNKKNNDAKIEYTGEEAKLLQLDTVVDEFIKDLPFTEKQIEMMRPGLKLMVEKNAGKIPPELLFYAGLLTSIGGNLAEYYSF